MEIFDLLDPSNNLLTLRIGFSATLHTINTLIHNIKFHLPRPCRSSEAAISE